MEGGGEEREREERGETKEEIYIAQTGNTTLGKLRSLRDLEIIFTPLKRE